MRKHLLATSLLLALVQPLCAAELPQVKTAAELKAVPAIALLAWNVKLAYADPGPEAGPWVLVYCDAKAVGGDAIEDRNTSPHPLGPLSVHVTWDGTKTLEPLQQRSTVQFPTGIYVAAVPLLQKGTCHIQIRNNHETIFAIKDLTITQVKPFYWHTLALDFSDHKKPPEAGKPAPAAIVSAAGLPGFQGIAPAIDTTALPANLLPDLLKAGLPGTLPMDAAWDTHNRDDLAKPDRFPLSLAIDKGNFIIRRHGEPMRGDAEETLLARWWVNGKPVIAERTTHVKQMRDALRQMTETKESTVQFGYPEALGKVKEGDRIALQVLYAPGGFSVMPESLQMDLLKTTGTNVPLLSNKIEFTLTRENIADHEKAMKE